VGTGGIGGYFGGLLARGGYDVTFLARGEHLSALQSHGLRLETVTGNFEVKNVQATDSVDGHKPFDVVLFCVKSYDNVTAAKTIAEAVSNNTVVLSIQNGIDNDREIQELLPASTVYPGLAAINSARTAPGVIKQVGGPCTIAFGDPANSTNQVLQDIALDMQKITIKATASAQIERDQWDKFIFVVAFGGMTALCRTPIGPVLNDPIAFDLYQRCVRETIAVAEAGNGNIDPQAFNRTMERIEPYRVEQANATASLLLDVLANRPTEIETLNGAVVRRAEQHNMDVPVNSMIYSAIRLANTSSLR
jgi:2-dehydropantoate 2-reductase